MIWTLLALIGIVLVGTIGLVYFRRCRERQSTLTAQTVRCPVNDDPATLAVRTLSIAHPGRRYMDVTACSLLPATSFVPPTRTAYFPDGFPCEPYISEVSQAPLHCGEMACPKGCLHVLNAADRVVGAPILCASGAIDSLELARQTQGPEMMRQIWLHST